jgi:hypothetical protein
MLCWTGIAAADAPYKMVEDAALGTTLPTDSRFLNERPEIVEKITKCVTDTPAAGPAVFYLEIGRKGVTTVKVHGSGKPKLDACIATSLKTILAMNKLPDTVGIGGRIDLSDGAQLQSARVSSAAVLVNPHKAVWQLTVNRIGYTSNRAEDIAAALDGVSAAIAACSSKRGAKAQPAEAMAWLDGKKALFRSGTPAYDACVGKALDGIKLPVAESALWMHLAIMKPAEPLAPRTDKAGLTKADALRDALTTAVRSRKSDLLGCTDGKAKAKLEKVGVALRGGKANVYKVSTGDTTADACVRNKFRDIAIPNAAADDKVELEITLEAAQ